MKQKRRLLLAMAALTVLLAVGLALAQALAAEPEPPLADSSLALTDYAPADITVLQYTRNGETVCLERTAEADAADGDESRWVLADRPEETVEQTLVNSMTTALGTLTATRDLGENGSLAQFGLDDPVLTVCATIDGVEHRYYYGDTNEVTGDVYLMVEGEINLYTVGYTSFNVFLYGADELIQGITADAK